MAHGCIKFVQTNVTDVDQRTVIGFEGFAHIKSRQVIGAAHKPVTAGEYPARSLGP